MTHVALYARVSTDRQDHERQIRELEEFVTEEYPDASVERFADIISGTDNEDGAEYRRLREAIAADEVGVVVVHELSRLSRLGGGEIHNVLQHALEHETSVRDLEVGLELDIDDSMVDQAVTQMIAGLMGDLARIEQKQKVRRVQSGIDATQEAGNDCFALIERGRSVPPPLTRSQRLVTPPTECSTENILACSRYGPTTGTPNSAYSTVTLFARFRGLSIGRPFSFAT